MTHEILEASLVVIENFHQPFYIKIIKITFWKCELWLAKSIELLDIECALCHVTGIQFDKKICPYKSAILDFLQKLPFAFAQNVLGRANFALINPRFCGDIFWLTRDRSPHSMSIISMAKSRVCVVVFSAAAIFLASVHGKCFTIYWRCWCRFYEEQSIVNFGTRTINQSALWQLKSLQTKKLVKPKPLANKMAAV